MIKTERKQTATSKWNPNENRREQFQSDANDCFISVHWDVELDFKYTEHFSLGTPKHTLSALGTYRILVKHINEATRFAWIEQDYLNGNGTTITGKTKLPCSDKTDNIPRGNRVNSGRFATMQCQIPNLMYFESTNMRKCMLMGLLGEQHNRWESWCLQLPNHHSYENPNVHLKEIVQDESQTNSIMQHRDKSLLTLKAYTI